MSLCLHGLNSLPHVAKATFDSFPPATFVICLVRIARACIFYRTLVVCVFISVLPIVVFHWAWLDRLDFLCQQLFDICSSSVLAGPPRKCEGSVDFSSLVAEVQLFYV